jgi:hypothetical protein
MKLARADRKPRVLNQAAVGAPVFLYDWSGGTHSRRAQVRINLFGAGREGVPERFPFYDKLILGARGAKAIFYRPNSLLIIFVRLLKNCFRVARDLLLKLQMNNLGFSSSEPLCWPRAVLTERGRQCGVPPWDDLGSSPQRDCPRADARPEAGGEAGR